MSRCNTAMYTTVFPNALAFLSAFSRSIAAQSDGAFDLWVGLDRLAVKDVEPLLRCEDGIQRVEAEDGDTPATIRQRAWRTIARRYDIVILVDSDDILGRDRVAAAKRGLRDADVYACALDLIAEDGRRYEKRFEVGHVSDWREFLASRNVFGLSNTAYRCNVLEACLPLAEKTQLIDWHLVSRALQVNAKLVFDNACHMSYRLYWASMARVLPPFDVEYLRWATGMVLRHYEALLPYTVGVSRQTQRLERRQEEVATFASCPAPRLEEYVRLLNQRQQDVYRWWECVAHEDLRSLWSA